MAKKPLSLLIAGTSHVGKTTLANSIAGKLGYRTFHTDKMGRHPGRPWPKARPFIADFYSSLKSETIFKLLQIHHQNMRPTIERTISVEKSRTGFVFEGCALRPELIHEHLDEHTTGICLTAAETVISARIRLASNYENLEPEHQRIVDSFIDRSLQDDQDQTSKAQEVGLSCVRVDVPGALEAFEADFIRLAMG